MLGYKSNSSIALLLLWLVYCHGQRLANPTFLWKLNLDDSQTRSLQKGNAVVASQDGEHIFATAADGSLHIINSKNAAQPITTVFEPPKVDGTISECSSGVAVVNDGAVNSYLVYAVINGLDSTVFGVNLDGTLKWQVDVEGEIVGTPVVSANAVYITRNVDAADGYLSVLLLTDDKAELTASLTPTEGNAPLGPPTLSFENGEDAVAVAESWEDGYGSQGNVYIVVPSNQYDNLDGKGNESYEMFHATSWPFSAVTKPIMAGSSLWLGATASSIGGWQAKDIGKVLEGRKENIDPQWELQLDPSELNENQPLMTTPAISDDLSLLVVPGSNGELYGVGSNNGQIQWSETPGSMIFAEPIIADDVVYVIESETGILRQHSIDDGNQLWQLDCDSNDVYCENDVVADFSIVSTGNVLYYGDISGNIVAVQIANFETAAPTGLASQAPTMSPTLSPTITANPTSLFPPTSQPTPTFETWLGTKNPSNDATPTTDGSKLNLVQQQEGQESDSTAVIVGSIIGALFVVGALVALFVVGGRRRRQEKGGGSKTESGTSSDPDVEYGLSRTPGKKSIFRKKNGTSATRGIEMDEEEGSARMHDADDSTRDLNDTFSLAAPSEGDDVNNPINLTDMLPSDVSQMSDDRFSDDESNVPVPPPPPVPKAVHSPIADGTTDAKNELDCEGINATTSSASMDAEESSAAGSPTVTPAAQCSPPVSPTSTVSESSLYMGTPAATGNSAESQIPSNLMPPALPDVIGTFMEEENHDCAPDDEIGMESSRDRLRMLQPSQRPPYHIRALGVDDESAPVDERIRTVPGAHYMANASMEQSGFDSEPLRRDNSIDGSGAKFRTSREIDSAREMPKKSSKQEGTDHWDGFMDELAEAEKMFSEPKFKSSNLLSDDESTDAGSSIMSYFGHTKGSMLGSDMSL